MLRNSYIDHVKDFLCIHEFPGNHKKSMEQDKSETKRNIKGRTYDN